MRSVTLETFTQTPYVPEQLLNVQDVNVRGHAADIESTAPELLEEMFANWTLVKEIREGAEEYENVRREVEVQLVMVVEAFVHWVLKSNWEYE